MKALEGVKILDFTHVQSGPTCTQLLAWFGADVIKVERAGEGDATRSQLRDIPNVDSLYFTMLNHNKRSITLDTKKPQGREVLDALIRLEREDSGVVRLRTSWSGVSEDRTRVTQSVSFEPAGLLGRAYLLVDLPAREAVIELTHRRLLRDLRQQASGSGQL